MRVIGRRAAICVVAGLVGVPVSSQSASPETTTLSRVETALSNVTALLRPGQDGLATIWDGNKYIQCRRMPDRALRCESAGMLMQPSLARVLVPERIARLIALGWTLDASFGNYVQTFPADAPTKDVAEKILQALVEGYQANLAEVEVLSDWIKSEPCPPRHGPTQNLAGMIDDSPAMQPTAVHGCSYRPKPGRDPGTVIRNAADLMTAYRMRVSGELQRLRVNVDRQKFVYVVVDTGAGYVQCGTQPPRAIYCEAQSAESWEVLERILTPDRVARLHAAGYSDPGRGPNYWKSYSLDDFTDAAIAEELLTILYEVYAYKGAPGLEFKTEKGG